MNKRRFVAVGMLALAVLIGLRAYHDMGQARLMAKYATPRYVQMTPQELAASSLSREELAKSAVAAQETAAGLAAEWQEADKVTNRVVLSLVAILGVYALFLFHVLWRERSAEPPQGRN